MLYVTTRNDTVTYASRHTLKSNFAPDGGLFIPVEYPHYTEDQLVLLKSKSFGETVADILNLFYPNQLSGWDVDFSIGRNVFRLIPMSHRIAVAEMWHNLGDELTYIIKQLYNKILATNSVEQNPSSWFYITSVIAILFALYGELMKSDMIHPHQKFDVSVSDHDFLIPMAAWYARKMGLPIGTIIYTCEENYPVWDLIYRGSFNAATSDKKLQDGIERLICATLGHAESQNFVNRCQSNQTYFIDDELLSEFSVGMFCAVPGTTRASNVISSIYRTNNYLLDPNTALCHGGMQDYRARSGISRLTLLLSEENPMRFVDEITTAAGISSDVLLAQMKQS